MKVKGLVVLFFVGFLISCANVKADKEFNSRDSWNEFVHVLTQQYAYIDNPSVNVQELLSEFEGRAIETKNKQAFIDICQMLLRHFNDPHLNLGPYDENDFSVFPTGSDIRAMYIGNKFTVTDVKSNSAADVAGIRVGVDVTVVDGTSARQAVEKVYGKRFEQLSLEQVNYGINISLGGYRNRARIIELNNQGETQAYHLAASYESINTLANGPTVSHKDINGIGYIRINNSLGNLNTVTAFNKAINDLLETKALIVDLRNTPSGGNTGVAEPILGHFVAEKRVYQQYRIQKNNVSYNDAVMEKAYVEPNPPYYTKPFVVLAGHWTGSMGEGMTIGFDAIGAATVIGAPMADLLGGIKTVKLTNSDAWMELGFERLYHVNNTYREDFEPHLIVDPADRDKNGNDPALVKALQYLNESLAK